MSEISNNALIELALDLSRGLVSKNRFQVLLDTVRKTINCDSVVLLALTGDILHPLGLQGLTRDALGRHFKISEHPRFKAICESKVPVRFSADSPLPDPYDGLLLDREGELPIHSCMGLPLHFENELVGVLTFDSLTPHMFEDIPQRTLDIISHMTAAHLKTAMTLDLLENQAMHSKQLVYELQREALNRDGRDLIGDSSAMQQLKNDIKIVASSELTVLIEGETGTGKELVARTLHQQSARSTAPLVHVNCAALPENLIESELFGHVKGAFTGAEKSRTGKFPLADGGTIFLDEIGEIPFNLQSKLLRVLQNQEIQRVGQDAIQKVNVRVIAATNRDLQKEVESGNFRADLYHRLSAYPITVPPLRNRVDDIALLTGWFLEKMRGKLGLRQLKVTKPAQTMLDRYEFSGNVRELEHIISRAALKAKSEQRDLSVKISTEHLNLPDSDTIDPLPATTYREKTRYPIDLREASKAFQAQCILEALEEHDSNMAATARALKMDRANLSRLAARLNIKIERNIKQS